MRLLLILRESDKREIEIPDEDPCLKNLAELGTNLNRTVIFF